MSTLRFVVVDVFTDTALAGNQLAVFTDGRGVDDDTMQALAKEIGFSETTFVLPPEASGHVRVRIFNPLAEMPFAGHPILGTAWVLATPLQRGIVELETGMGVVPVEIDRDESGALVFGRMKQPIPTVRSWTTPRRCSPCSTCLGQSSRSSCTTTAPRTSSSRSEATRRSPPSRPSRPRSPASESPA